jgi:DNA-binding NarL/FixJ family response regulator
MATHEATPTDRKGRVVIIDDHPIIRHGLTELIREEADLEVSGAAENADDGLALVETSRPDLAIVDISLSHSSGIDLVKSLRGRHPELRILVLSVHDESLYAERALRAGASGYIMKEEATENLILAIRRVLHGEIYLSSRMSDRLLDGLVHGRARSRPDSKLTLSDRELHVFEMIGRGIGSREIAERLGLSVKTVDAHRANIKAKLGLRKASELVQHAVQWVQFGEL